MSDFPALFFRGLPRNSLDAHGRPEPGRVFSFQRPKEKRADGRHEMSITWDDEPAAKQLLLDARGEDGLKYPDGILELDRTEVDRQLAKAMHTCLEYERKETPENKYHGNVTVAATDPIARELAKSVLHVSMRRVIRQA